MASSAEIQREEQELDALIRRKGIQDPMVLRACQQLCENLNAQGLKLLHSDSPEEALKLLRKAEILASNAKSESEMHSPVEAITYNNIACCLKRKGKLRSALRYLEVAREIEKACGESAADPPGTMLNLCAVLSDLGRHDAALAQAQAAAELLQHQIDAESESEQSAGRRRGRGKNVKMQLSLLAVAYHNIGVQHEHRGDLPAAIDAYSEGMLIAKYGGEESGSLLAKLKQSHSEANSRLKASESRRTHPQSSASGYTDMYHAISDFRKQGRSTPSGQGLSKYSTATSVYGAQEKIKKFRPHSAPLTYPKSSSKAAPLLVRRMTASGPSEVPLKPLRPLRPHSALGAVEVLRGGAGLLWDTGGKMRDIFEDKGGNREVVAAKELLKGSKGSDWRMGKQGLSKPLDGDFQELIRECARSAGFLEGKLLISHAKREAQDFFRQRVTPGKDDLTRPASRRVKPADAQERKGPRTPRDDPEEPAQGRTKSLLPRPRRHVEMSAEDRRHAEEEQDEVGEDEGDGEEDEISGRAADHPEAGGWEEAGEEEDQVEPLRSEKTSAAAGHHRLLRMSDMFLSDDEDEDEIESPRSFRNRVAGYDAGASVLARGATGRSSSKGMTKEERRRPYQSADISFSYTSGEEEEEGK
uniref:MalT-like TPR region domain-containing protein n=1 Tax=Hanusia phi TaxID=3032 RepID=A0A7S0HJL7_9CRYP|mmetsp:Transcript_24521/g.55347  ORF Transcript_24521/g.55347 Transcript_24521/m.55347 type:complete len:642 (+) Transcript_24521:233-2158(+)